MGTYTQIIYHLVFSTKRRKRSLMKPGRDGLFRYMWGIVKNNRSHLYRINGIEDHVHLVTSLHPTVRLADFIKDLKTGSSKWIKEERLFPEFEHWQDGYAAFTHSIGEKNALIEYVKNQEEHHRIRSFTEELIRLLEEAGIEYDPKYLA